MYCTVRTSCVLAALTVNYSSYARGGKVSPYVGAGLLAMGGGPIGKYSAYNANGGGGRKF